MRIIIIKAKTLVICAAAVFAAALLVLSPRVISRNSGAVAISRFDRADNKIALTFDCSKDAGDIDDILNTLKQYNCRAAFFVTGEFAQAHPDALEKIHNAGQAVENNTFCRADYSKMSADEIREDIQKTDESIRSVCGEVPRYLRAPDGSCNSTVINTAAESGKICISSAIDAKDDAKNADEESILYNLAKTSSGDIICMHAGTEYAAKLLPRILKGLKKSFEFVGLDELSDTHDAS